MPVCSSRHGHQHHQGGQGRNHTRQTLVKIKPQHLHIPHASRSKRQRPDTVTPFVIVNFSHHENLHLPKDHVVAFTEKDTNQGEVLEICTMKELERDLPRNWIPERQCQEKMTKLFQNPFMKKKDDFLKSPAEAPTHRKVLLEDKEISPKTQRAFEKLCERYDEIISKNSGDISKTILVEMEIDTGNHPLLHPNPTHYP